jgi:hypothetical protein
MLLHDRGTDVDEPWVWLISGERFNVQLMKSAFSPVKS